MGLCPHTQVSLQWNGDSLWNQNSKGWSWICSNSSYNLFLNLTRTPIPNPYRKTHLSSLKSTPPLDVWLDSAQLIMVGGSEAGLTPNHGCERLGDRAWVFILVFDKKVNHFAYNMVSFFLQTRCYIPYATICCWVFHLATYIKECFLNECRPPPTLCFNLST